MQNASGEMTSSPSTEIVRFSPLARDISSAGGSAARVAEAIHCVPGHHFPLELPLRAG
jgi:hypothetical protein